MIYLTRRAEFSSSHFYHNPEFTPEENRRIFGKCNNPHGHGHNYEVEITIRGEVDRITGRALDVRRLDEIAEDQILKPLRYRNLNEEVPAFRELVPTTENLAAELDRRLRSAWPEVFPPGGPVLEKIRIWETERNICEIYHA